MTDIAVPKRVVWSSEATSPPRASAAIAQRETSIQTRPFRTSHASVAAAAPLPTERATLVVPMLPDPTVLTSTWPMARAITRPKGMPQTR